MHSFALLAIGLALAAGGEAQITLGSAASFGALAASTVTNAGDTVIVGNLGVSPGSALTGFSPGGPGTVVGDTDSANPASVNGQSDAQKAYEAITALPIPNGNDLSGQNLGGMTLTAGTYNFATTANLNGNLTLDTGGNPNAQFVFVIGTAFATTVSSRVLTADGGQACNVYWRVGSSANIAVGTSFKGNIIAKTAISVFHQASFVGGLFALGAAISLDDNAIVSQQNCDS